MSFGFPFLHLESSNVCCLALAAEYVSVRWALKGGTGVFGQSDVRRCGVG